MWGKISPYWKRDVDEKEHGLYVDFSMQKSTNLFFFFSGVVSQGPFCFPFFFHTLDFYVLGVKLRHDTMHFLDKYEDPSALKPTTTGVKGPELAKKSCTLQHGWRGPKSTVSMTRFAEFVVKIGGGGSPWFCSPENSYHLNLFVIKIQKWHEGDPWRPHLMRSHKFDCIKISSSLVKPTRYPFALHF